MKLSMIAILFAFSLTAMAKPEDLTEVKNALMAHLDMRISHLQEAKKCVSAANTKEAMKVCRTQMHEKMKAMKEAGMEEKKNRKAKRDAKKS